MDWELVCVPSKDVERVQTHKRCCLPDGQGRGCVVRLFMLGLVLSLRPNKKLADMASDVETAAKHAKSSCDLLDGLQGHGLVENGRNVLVDIAALEIRD